MSWNYRIIHERKWDSYALHEVHYNDAGYITSWTRDPIRFAYDTKDDILQSLKQALNDAETLPILELSELEKELKKE